VEFIQGSEEIATSFFKSKWGVNPLLPISRQHQLDTK